VELVLLQHISPAPSILDIRPPISTTQFPCVFLYSVIPFCISVGHVLIDLQVLSTISFFRLFGNSFSSKALIITATQKQLYKSRILTSKCIWAHYAQRLIHTRIATQIQNRAANIITVMKSQVHAPSVAENGRVPNFLHSVQRCIPLRPLSASLKSFSLTGGKDLRARSKFWDGLFLSYNYMQLMTWIN
jgi:hypothetical protein